MLDWLRKFLSDPSMWIPIILIIICAIFVYFIWKKTSNLDDSIEGLKKRHAGLQRQITHGVILDDEQGQLNLNYHVDDDSSQLSDETPPHALDNTRTQVNVSDRDHCEESQLEQKLQQLNREHVDHGDNEGNEYSHDGSELQGYEEQEGPYQEGPYEEDTYQEDTYQEGPYEEGPYEEQEGPYEEGPYQEDPCDDIDSLQQLKNNDDNKMLQTLEIDELSVGNEEDFEEISFTESEDMIPPYDDIDPEICEFQTEPVAPAIASTIAMPPTTVQVKQTQTKVPLPGTHTMAQNQKAHMTVTKKPEPVAVVQKQVPQSNIMEKPTVAIKTKPKITVSLKPNVVNLTGKVLMDLQQMDQENNQEVSKPTISIKKKSTRITKLSDINKPNPFEKISA